MYDYNSMAVKPTSKQLEKICGQLLPESAWMALPQLPSVHDFPEVMGNMILDIPRKYKSAYELSIANALGATLIAALGTLDVRIPETQSTVLCAACILACADSGERKSDSQAEFKKPLLEWEAEQIKKEEVHSLERQAEMKALKLDLKNIERRIERKAAKNLDYTADREDLKRLVLQAAKTDARRITNLFISHDATASGIVRHMEKNGGLASIFTDEGDLTFFMKDPPKGDLFRQGISGGSISLTRATRDIFIPEAVFNYVCSPTYAVLKNLGSLPVQGEHGSHPRIWFISAPPLKGQRKSLNHLPSNTPHSYSAWREKIRQMLESSNRRAEKNKRQTLYLAPEAEHLWIYFCNNIEERIAKGDLADLSEWASKATGGILKLVGCLHFFNDPSFESTIISREQLEKAVRIYEWLIEHAKYAYRIMFPKPGQRHVHNLLYTILAHELVEFSAGSLINKLKKSQDKTQDWYEAIHILEDYGYLVLLEDENKLNRRRGRPSYRYGTTQQFTDAARMAFEAIRPTPYRSATYIL